MEEPPEGERTPLGGRLHPALNRGSLREHATPFMCLSWEERQQQQSPQTVSSGQTPPLTADTLDFVSAETSALLLELSCKSREGQWTM